MADFTGMSVRVNLKQSSQGSLLGRVKEVVPGQTITLQDGESRPRLQPGSTNDRVLTHFSHLPSIRHAMGSLDSPEQCHRGLAGR